jgi:hypothetical protein
MVRRAIRSATAKPMRRADRLVVSMGLGVILVACLSAQSQPPVPAPEQGFRFKSGVELINVTAMVSDASGRFVPGLQKDDFAVYEDDLPQTVTHFSAERVPISLGIAVDTSGSMAGEKIRAAQTALGRFLYDVLDARDEIFLYRFSDRSVERWVASLLTAAPPCTTPSRKRFVSRPRGRIVRRHWCCSRMATIRPARRLYWN